MLTLGSLFDGMGAFPLAGVLNGLNPKWASEVYPDAVRVTSERFPKMTHLGDIRGIDGGQIEPVDVITFGSPCQNLSVAGNREGLAGSESGLFFEALRVITEMRDATGGCFPRWLVWENVPGALSLNGGNDFETVVRQISALRGISIECPRPGRWEPFGAVLGHDYGLSWIILNARWFGLPQNRERLFLIADLGPNGRRMDAVRGNTEGRGGHAPKSGPQGCISSPSAPSCTGAAGEWYLPVDPDYIGDEVVARLLQRAVCSGDVSPVSIAMPRIGAVRYESGTVTSYSTSRGDYHARSHTDYTGALTAGDEKEPPTVCVEWPYESGSSIVVRRLTPEETLRLQGFPSTWLQTKAAEPTENSVRKWSEIWDAWALATKKGTKTNAQVREWLRRSTQDRAAYHLCGNSIALPCAEHVLRRVAQMKEVGIAQT